MASRVTWSGVKDVCGVGALTIDLVASPTGDDHKLGKRSSGAANQNVPIGLADQLNTFSEASCSGRRSTGIELKVSINYRLRTLLRTLAWQAKGQAANTPMTKGARST